MWEKRRSFRVYAATFALVAAALTVHFALRPWLGDHLVLLFFLSATLVSAWVGGLGPGLVALALGFLLGDFFFLPPRFDFVVRGTSEFLSLVIYFFCGLFGVAAIDRFHRAKYQLNASETHRQVLKHEIEERLRVERNLRISEQNLQHTQEELKKHAEMLEQRVGERTASLRQSLESLENVVYCTSFSNRARASAPACGPLGRTSQMLRRFRPFYSNNSDWFW